MNGYLRTEKKLIFMILILNKGYFTGISLKKERNIKKKLK